MVRCTRKRRRYQLRLRRTAFRVAVSFKTGSFKAALLPGTARDQRGEPTSPEHSSIQTTARNRFGYRNLIFVTPHPSRVAQGISPLNSTWSDLSSQSGKYPRKLVAKLQRALVANSQPRPRYSDIEEVQIARMGSVHAGCPLFPLHLHPSDTMRERPTRAGMERLRHNSRHNFSRCAASIASGQAGRGVA
jgi:hypothetical protein